MLVLLVPGGPFVFCFWSRRVSTCTHCGRGSRAPACPRPTRPEPGLPLTPDSYSVSAAVGEGSGEGGVFRPDAGPHSPALHHASPLSPTEDTGAAHLGPRLAPRNSRGTVGLDIGHLWSDSPCILFKRGLLLSSDRHPNRALAGPDLVAGGILTVGLMPHEGRTPVPWHSARDSGGICKINEQED